MANDESEPEELPDENTNSRRMDGALILMKQHFSEMLFLVLAEGETE